MAEIEKRWYFTSNGVQQFCLFWTPIHRLPNVESAYGLRKSYSAWRVCIDQLGHRLRVCFHRVQHNVRITRLTAYDESQRRITRRNIRVPVVTLHYSRMWHERPLLRIQSVTNVVAGSMVSVKSLRRHINSIWWESNSNSFVWVIRSL